MENWKSGSMASCGKGDEEWEWVLPLAARAGLPGTRRAEGRNCSQQLELGRDRSRLFQTANSRECQPKSKVRESDA